MGPNIVHLPQKDRRYDEASQWIARLDRQLSDEELAALRAWIAEHPDNEAVLLEMAALWDKMDALKRLSSLFPAPVPRSRHASLYALASVAMLAVVSVCLWLFWGSIAPHRAATDSAFVYQTHLGEHSSVTLQDGTQMVLNTNSRVRVKYTSSARLLTLERGEVFVEVARDKSRPLSVIAAGQIVQAVGTAFNVEINNDRDIELIVVEGKVKVGAQQVSAHIGQPPSPEISPPTERTVVAGESINLISPKKKVKPVSSEDIEARLSWRRGNLVFRGESLEDAVREIERYTPVEFVFKDEDLKKIRVAGLFRAGDVDGLLATLKENFNINYRYTDNRRVELDKQSP